MKIVISNIFMLNLCIWAVYLYLRAQSKTITMTITVSLSGKKITATATATATVLCVNSSAGSMPRGQESCWLKFKESVVPA